MKKMFICAAVVGVATGVVCYLCKKEKANAVISNTKTEDKKVGTEMCFQEEAVFQHANVEEEMYQAKNESAQAMYERHSEASSIMRDAYNNIMEDFSGEKDADIKDKNKEVIIDSESVSVIKEIDSISDELDDLLR